MSTSGFEEGVSRVLLHYLEDFSQFAFACILPVYLWQTGEADNGKRQDTSESCSASHCTVFSVWSLLFLRQSFFQALSPVALSFAYSEGQTQAPCIFLSFLSRRKPQYWAWTCLTLAAGHFHRRWVFRKSCCTAPILWFHFSALWLCTSSWAVHQLSAPYLPLLSPKRYCCSLLQPKTQNICEEQGFICSITASDAGGIAKAWHEGRLYAAQKPGPSSSKPGKRSLCSSKGKLGSQTVSEWSWPGKPSPKS